jgi:protein-disulfide isomerase
MAQKTYKQTRRELAIQEEKQRKMRNLMILTVALIILIAGAVMLDLKGSKSSNPSDKFQLENQPVMGKADAPITLVEFGDFKCPVCKQFATNVLPKLKADYIDTGKAKLYFINDSFIGPDSTTAAMALESVYHQKPDAAWPYIEEIYRNQQDEKIQWATPEKLVDIARKANIGVDYDKLLSDLKANKYKSESSSDNAIAQKSGVTGTPTVFVNGQEISLQTSLTYDELKSNLDSVLKQGAGK